MGALTLKPSAYRARPWELTRVEVFNHYEGVGTLVLHLRGSRVIRVAQPGWMKDRIRFLYDGLQRQRLTEVYHKGYPTGWSTGVVEWFTRAARVNPFFRVDAEVVHFFWLLRGYTFIRDGRGLLVSVAVDTPVGGDIFHGSFGLKPVDSVGVALPGCLTHEEEGVLPLPRGGSPYFLTMSLLIQLLAPPVVHPYGWTNLITPGVDLPRQPHRALFQVSPLQGLLPVEW